MKIFNDNMQAKNVLVLMVKYTGQVAAVIPVSNKKYHIQTEKRPLEVYAKVGGSR